MIIYLHIGTHKTGTSAIQNLFDKNRDYFVSQGLYYPSGYNKWSGHHNIPWMIMKKKGGSVENVMSKIVSKAKKLHCERVLLSSEEFEFVRNRRALASLSEYGEVRVICYLRKQYEYLESEYNQHIKMYDVRFDSDIFHFNTYHNFHVRFNYFVLLQPWIEAFGSDKVYIISYDKLGKGDGIYKAIFKVLQIDGDKVIYPHGSENKSLSSLSTLYLSRLNKIKEISLDQHSKAILFLKDNIEIDNRSLLSFEYKKRIFGRYCAANKIISEMFLYGEPLFDSNIKRAGVIDYYDDFDDSLYLKLQNYIKVFQ